MSALETAEWCVNSQYASIPITNCSSIMRRHVRVVAFQYSVTVGTYVMLTEEAICVHVFLLLVLASIGCGLYVQCHPLISSIAG